MTNKTTDRVNLIKGRVITWKKLKNKQDTNQHFKNNAAPPPAENTVPSILWLAVAKPTFTDCYYPLCRYFQVGGRKSVAGNCATDLCNVPYSGLQGMVDKSVKVGFVGKQDFDRVILAGRSEPPAELAASREITLQPPQQPKPPKDNYPAFCAALIRVSLHCCSP